MSDDVVVNPEIISDKSSVELSNDCDIDTLKEGIDSLKPEEGFIDDEVSNISFKPADDSSEIGADMASVTVKGSNPLDSDFAMSTLPMLVVISEGLVLALANKNDPKKSSVGFRSSTNVDMVDQDKNMSNLQQWEDNTAANASTSHKTAALNKVITPI